MRTFEECVLGLAMVRLRRVSLERRHGNLEEAEHLLQDAIKNAKSNNESSFYAVKLARHLFKIQKNLPKSRKVLLEAIERDKVCICIFKSIFYKNIRGQCIFTVATVMKDLVCM